MNLTNSLDHVKLFEKNGRKIEDMLEKFLTSRDAVSGGVLQTSRRFKVQSVFRCSSQKSERTTVHVN